MTEAQGKRLDSWKEIAAFLGRDVTTVRRWEKLESLPVRRHRHTKLGSVYAHTAELDAWLAERASGTPAGGSPAPQAAPFPPAPRGLPVLALAVLAVALVGFSAWFLLSERAQVKPGSEARRIQSLAVLPLVNFSGDPAQEFLADGMTEALIARLSVIRGLRVISRTSVMRFKGTRQPLSEIAKQLKVDAVVEGSILRSGDQIRITVQLIRGASDEHLWSTTLDRELRDVLTLQSEIAQGIARHIEATFTGREADRLLAARSVSPEVYESYLKGRFALHKSGRPELVEAIDFFQDAIDGDATFAPAYAGLAAAHRAVGTVFFGGAPAEARAKVMASLQKALELDPELVEAHILHGELLQQDWRWAEAEAEYGRALEVNPSDSGAHVGYARWLLCQGRTQEARLGRTRTRAGPLALIGMDIGWILFHARRYDEAIREVRGVLSVDPGVCGHGGSWHSPSSHRRSSTRRSRRSNGLPRLEPEPCGAGRAGEGVRARRPSSRRAASAG
jgi:TolB-like protein